jgi:hypothetical protein
MAKEGITIEDIENENLRRDKWLSKLK